MAGSSGINALIHSPWLLLSLKSLTKRISVCYHLHQFEWSGDKSGLSKKLSDPLRGLSCSKALRPFTTFFLNFLLHWKMLLILWFFLMRSFCDCFGVPVWAVSMHRYVFWVWHAFQLVLAALCEWYDWCSIHQLPVTYAYFCLQFLLYENYASMKFLSWNLHWSASYVK